MLTYKSSIFLALASIIVLVACNNNSSTHDTAPSQTESVRKDHPKPVERKKPVDYKYSVAKAKDYFKLNDSTLTPEARNILMAVNRTDSANLKKQDSLIVPSNFDGDLAYYLPFPLEVDALKDVEKIIVFSYPAQVFAAYSYGNLLYTGPTNMGRAHDPTPAGLYFTNWKAEETTSTFNDEWDLKWNFNIENTEGIGFHEYSLPGYPASHSCLRLRESDAKLLYNWADQWELKGTDDIRAKGTPVIVFGEYPFGKAKPWFQLPSNPRALDISAGQLKSIVEPFIKEILAAQQQRDSYMATVAK